MGGVPISKMGPAPHAELAGELPVPLRTLQRQRLLVRAPFASTQFQLPQSRSTFSGIEVMSYACVCSLESEEPPADLTGFPCLKEPSALCKAQNANCVQFPNEEASRKTCFTDKIISGKPSLCSIQQHSTPGPRSSELE